MGSNCATWVLKPWWQIKQQGVWWHIVWLPFPGSFICLQLSTREYHCVQISKLGLQGATLPLPAHSARVMPVMSNYTPSSCD